MPTKSKTEYADYSFDTISGSASLLSAITWATDKRVFSLASSRTDSGRVDKYLRKIAKGDNATSSLTGTAQVSKRTVGGYILSEYQTGWRNNSDPVNYHRYGRRGEMTSNSLPTASWGSSTRADNQAKQKFSARIRSAQTSFTGMVFLGELREAIRMLKSPAKSLRELLEEYKNMARSRVVRARKNNKQSVLSNTWLEYSYGLAPLFSDADSAAEALARILTRPAPFTMVSAYGNHEQLLASNLYSWSNSIAQNVKYDISSKRYYRNVVIYRGVVDAVIDGSGPQWLGRARDLSGFNVREFVPTLWELTPYSFLVDYFTNIGDMITAASFGRMGLRWSSRTEVKEHVEERATCNARTYNIPSTAHHVSFGYAPGESSLSRRWVTRDPWYQGNFIPSLEFEIPGSRSLKWLNLAALANNRINKRL